MGDKAKSPMTLTIDAAATAIAGVATSSVVKQNCLNPRVKMERVRRIVSMLFHDTKKNREIKINTRKTKSDRIDSNLKKTLTL